MYYVNVNIRDDMIAGFQSCPTCICKKESDSVGGPSEQTFAIEQFMLQQFHMISTFGSESQNDGPGKWVRAGTDEIRDVTIEIISGMRVICESRFKCHIWPNQIEFVNHLGYFVDNGFRANSVN
jgi:hypothetical protein